jgi:hypothetical protein
MKTHQKALVILTRPGDRHELDDLNIALRRGWRVAHVTAMGAAGIGTENGLPELCFAALVIIERDHDDAEALPALAEEIPEALLDDAEQGDGAGPALEDFDVDLGLGLSEQPFKKMPA